jgi:hypothetical protein
VAHGKVVGVRIGVLAVGVVLLATGCGSDDGSPDKEGHSLSVTREDGSQVKLPDEVHAWCGPARFAPPAEDERAPSPPKPTELWVVGGRLPAEGAERADTFWMFSWPTKGIKRAPRITLPTEDLPHSPLFVYDSPERNQLSGSQERATGTVEVEEWGCRKGDTVRISVDATLEGELFRAPTATVEGEVETVIGDPLAVPE